MAPPGAWRPGPYFPLGDNQPSVQYKEYERAAQAHGRVSGVVACRVLSRLLTSCALDRKFWATTRRIVPKKQLLWRWLILAIPPAAFCRCKSSKRGLSKQQTTIRLCLSTSQCCRGIRAIGLRSHCCRKRRGSNRCSSNATLQSLLCTGLWCLLFAAVRTLIAC